MDPDRASTHMATTLCNSTCAQHACVLMRLMTLLPNVTIHDWRQDSFDTKTNVHCAGTVGTTEEVVTVSNSLACSQDTQGSIPVCINRIMLASVGRFLAIPAAIISTPTAFFCLKLAFRLL